MSIIKTILKLLFLNLIIVVINIAVFSKGLLGVSFQSSAILLAFGITTSFTSFIVFIYGNYKILAKPKEIVTHSEITTIDNCIYTLSQVDNKAIFGRSAKDLVEQLKRFQHKKEIVDGVLLQKFSPTGLTYIKFNETVFGVEKVLLTNAKGVINKINAFDEEEYRSLTKGKLNSRMSREMIRAKVGIYNQYIDYVQEAIRTNEEILVKLDLLLLELSKFNSLDGIDILEMEQLKDMEDLISKVKLYR